jgi:hypothetical protein
MCKAPKPPTPKEPKKPEFLRNRYLDAFVGGAQSIASLRSGRSSLRIPQGGEAKSAPSLPRPEGQPDPQPIRGDFRVGPRRGRNELR